MDGIQICGNAHAGEEFSRELRGGRFLFSFLLSYTRTCEIPGITVAGANPEMTRYTPPADAEFIQYGYCKSIDGLPMTPDGKPTPALLTRAALRSSGIPHVPVGAGSAIDPQLPFLRTGISPGGNISVEDGMPMPDLQRAIEYGKMAGAALAGTADCLVIGESIPGGTTTAQAVLRGLGYDARSSSSMPQNPVLLKEQITEKALARLRPGDALGTVAQLCDPMVPFAAGMLSASSRRCRVMLAGGTQMAAVLAVAGLLGFDAEMTAIGTTRYVAEDGTANLLDTVSAISDIPVLAVDPGLDRSRIGGLRAFSEGFAKEGAGAGGCIISAMLRTGITTGEMRELAEAEYSRVLT